MEADTGVIGGKFSHEFMVPAETGENEVVFCEGCGYAANMEKATSGIPKTAAREIGAAVEKFATPGVRDHRGADARRLTTFRPIGRSRRWFISPTASRSLF